MMEDTVDALVRNRRHVRWNLSLSEILRDSAVHGLQLDDPDNSDLLRAMLYKYGMDIDKHYEVEVCEHRNVYGEAVICQYFLGIERTDQHWHIVKESLLSGLWKIAS